MREKYGSVIFGILLGLTTLLYAESLAGTIGLYEDDIKGAFRQEALEHTAGETVKGHEKESDLSGAVFKDRKEAEEVVEEAWEYLMLAHVHAEGMGIIIIVLSLIIGHSLLKEQFKKLISIMIGLGGIVYPLCWVYVGIFMADKGEEAARGDVHYFAISSVTLYLTGISLVLGLLLLHTFFRNMQLVRFFFEKES